MFGIGAFDRLPSIPYCFIGLEAPLRFARLYMQVSDWPCRLRRKKSIRLTARMQTNSIAVQFSRCYTVYVCVWHRRVEFINVVRSGLKQAQAGPATLDMSNDVEWTTTKLLCLIYVLATHDSRLDTHLNVPCQLRVCYFSCTLYSVSCRLISIYLR